MDNCIQTLPNKKAVNALDNHLNLNAVLATSVYLNCTENGELTDEFKEFCKSEGLIDAVISLDSDSKANANKIAELMYKFYYKNYPSVSFTSQRRINDSTSSGYTSPMERENGKHHVANMLLKEHVRLINTNQAPRTNVLKYYLKHIKNTWLNRIFELAAETSNLDVTDLRQGYENTQDKLGYLTSLLDSSPNAKNHIAVYSELFGTEFGALRYLGEVLYDSRLGGLYRMIMPDIQSLSDRLAENSSQTDFNHTQKDGLDDFIPDLTIFNLTTHSGNYSSFALHVSEELRNYFNTLPKYLTPSLGNVDTTTSYGIADTMDASKCIAILYNMANTRNLQTFIASVKRIANTVKGFESFVEFAKKLEEDNDFAMMACRTFMKMKIKRVQINEEEEGNSVEIANDDSDPFNVYISDLINDSKATTIAVNPIFVQREFTQIKEELKNISKLSNVSDEDVEGLKNKVVDILKALFPSIKEDGIRAFIELSKGSDNKSQLQAIKKIVGVDALGGIIENLEKVQASYDSMLANIQQIVAYNKALDKKKQQGIWVDANEYKSTFDAYRTDYTASIFKYIHEVAKYLTPYTNVETNLNSRNIYGNNVSSIINSSHLTNLLKIIEDFKSGNKESLLSWGKRKLALPQYKYSHLLLEQKGNDDNIISRGIFRYNTNGELEITEYAQDVIDIAQFNGSANRNSGNNASYADMTLGDYSASAFIAFYETDPSGKYANYFMRTPSDASNNFLFRTTRYSTNNILVDANSEKTKENVDAIIDIVMPIIKGKDFLQYFNDGEIDKVVNSISGDAVSKYIGPRHNSTIYIPNAKSIKYISGIEAYVPYKLSNGTVVIMTGEVFSENNVYKLRNAKAVGVSDVNFNTYKKDESVANSFRGLYKSYYNEQLTKGNVTINGVEFEKTEFVIDTKHPVFNLFRNRVKQEILDGANAVIHYFQLTKKSDGTYVVKLDNDGKPLLRASNSRGYANYHKKGGKVMEYKDGSLKLLGDVFRSTSFTLNFEKEDGTFENRNYLDDLFDTDAGRQRGDGIVDFLYGGVISFIMDESDETLNTISDVSINDDSITSELDSAISSFLKDYIEYVYNFLDTQSDFINGKSVGINSAAEFGLNNMLTAYTYDELFEGNTKFYKNVQTLLKRVKERQASGDPYGMADYSGDFVPNLDEVEGSYLQDGIYEEPEIEVVTIKGHKVKRVKHDESGKVVTTKTPIKEIFAGTILEGITLRKGFTGVTIANTEKTNDNVLKELRDKLVSQGVKDNKIDDILYGVKDETGKRSGGFTDITVNDAQSYITVHEWVRRIAGRGQLKKYMPLIKKIIDPNAVITAKDLENFVQVQKNVYYDLYYDSNYNIEVPRFIKNAEFVLIPQLIKGTQLQRVYEMMQTAGIDQLNTVETSKAANEDVITLWDNDGNFVGVDDFVRLASANKQIFSYNNLFTQQETPQHMDSKNKVGVQVAKKIIDNIDDNDPVLGYLKQRYQQLYSLNIENSFEELANEIGFEVDDIGQTKNLDVEVLYDKIKEEFARTGLTKNLVDFVEVTDGGYPRMPAIINNVVQTMENKVHAVFNNAIKRQKLKGFHAAQVSNLGFSKDQIATSDELKFHPEGKGYIEVMVPYSYLGIDRNSSHYKDMSEEEILKELHNKGLDEFIGYRIPTEGKQSACVMRVKHFLDDAYGSTIILPDEWVAQSGSDFDIDSVYGMQAETYIKADGEVMSIDLKNVLDEQDYVAYLRRYISQERGSKVRKEISELIAAINSLVNEEYEKLQESQTKIFDKISEKGKLTISSIQRNAKATAEKNTSDKTEQYIIVTKIVSTNLKRLYDTFENKETTDGKAIKKLIDNLDKIHDFLNNRDNEVLTTLINDKSLAKIINKAGLPSFHAFASNPDTYQDSRARNTEIVNIFKYILRNPKSLEENLSRSNFDALKTAKNRLMSDEQKADFKNRNPYDIVGQLRFQSEAMSGADLKAFSVTLDTFCSLCNSMKPTMTNPVTIIYQKSDVESTFKEIEDRFDANRSEDDNYISVKHDTYGWSKDNRSIDGDLLTVYSSETTAYNLDVIKEGSIPNLNKYTFGVFKTLANIGTNYYTSVGFIMQPGIKRIVDNNDRTNSIFYRGYSSNPIYNSIKDIAKDLRKVDKSFNITNEEINNISILIKKLNDRYGDLFRKLFLTKTLTISTDADVPIIPNTNEQRLKGKLGSPVKEFVYDLGVIIAFNNIRNNERNIQKLLQISHPDSTNNKSPYESRQFIKNLIKAIDNESLFIQTEDGIKNFITELYPFASNFEDITPDLLTNERIIQGILLNNDDSKSKYQFVNAFLKYGIAAPLAISSKIISTEQPQFVKFVDGLEKVFSDNKEMDEETFNDFRSFSLGAMYNMLAASDAVENNQYEERARIFGYGKNANNYVEFDITDGGVNIEEFKHLSPAAKVQLVSSKLADKGIFDYLTTSLFNSRRSGRYTGMQRISFIDNNINKDALYNLFEEAYFNDNLYIAETAKDIVRYALVVENMKLGRTAINKIVSNEVFMQNDNFDINTLFNSFIQTLENKDFANKIYEYYLRTGKGLSKLNSLYLTNTNIRNYNIAKHNYGIISIERDIREGDEEYVEKLLDAGIFKTVKGFVVPNKYINVVSNNKITLYKINYINTTGDVVLTPLHKLEENESVEWSANDNNNKQYLSGEGYDYIIKKYEDVAKNINLNGEFIAAAIKEASDKNMEFTPPVQVILQQETNIDFNLEELAKTDVGIDSVLKSIIEHYSNNRQTSSLYVRSIPLGKYIKVKELASIHTITINGQTRTFAIIKPKDLDEVSVTFLQEDNDIDLIKNKSINKIIKDAKKIGLLWLNDVYKIIEVKAPAPTSVATFSRGEEIETIINNAGTFARNRQTFLDDNQNECSFLQSLKDKDIDYKSKELYNRDAALQLTAKYLVETSKNLIDDFNRFHEDPTTITRFISLGDIDEIKQYLSDNEPLMDKAIALINQIQALKKVISDNLNSSFKGEPTINKAFIEDIKSSLTKLNDLNVKEVTREIATMVLKNNSTSPLVREDLIDVFDNYWALGNVDYWFNDITENGNSLFQIMLRNIQEDIETKRIVTQSNVNKIRNKIDDIKRKAKAHGLNVSWSKIVKRGKLYTPYTEQFTEKYEELKEARDKAGNKYGKGSIEHLKARYAYETFKAKHINQKAKREYYVARQVLEYNILKTYPEIYSEYRKLDYEKYEIISSAVNGELNEDQRDKLNKIRNAQFNLLNVSGSWINQLGFSEDRPIDGPLGQIAASELAETLRSINDLVSKYFENEEEYGFRTQLNHYLSVIDSFENRDANGIPSVPQDVLDQNDTYREAKDWILKNAHYVINLLDEDGNPSKFNEDLQKALNILGLRGNARSEKVNKLFREANDKKGIYDAQRTPNGNLLTDEERKQLKEIQEDYYHFNTSASFSDRRLISNARPTDDVYTAAFYKGVTSKTEQGALYYKTVSDINKILSKYFTQGDKNVHLELIPDTKEGIEDALELARLYRELKDFRKPTNNEFFKNNAKIVLNEEYFEAQKKEISHKSSELKEALVQVLYQTTEDGQIMLDKQNKPIPNTTLFGYIVPTSDSFIDKEKTIALKLVSEVYKRVPTKYYYQAKHEAMLEAYENPGFDYNKWYNDNHVYNPYTRMMEPLPCWTTSEYNTDYLDNGMAKGKWMPSHNQSTRKVKDGTKTTYIGNKAYKNYNPLADMRNKDYKDNLSPIDNYIKGSGYDNDVELNEFEKEMVELVKTELFNSATNNKTRAFFNKNYMPRVPKNTKSLVGELLKSGVNIIGLGLTAKDGSQYNDDVDYYHNYAPNAPFTELLGNKNSAKLKKEKKRLEEEPSSVERNERLKEINKELEEINISLLNEDWEQIIPSYLEAVGRYNAIQQNVNKLYFLQNLLGELKTRKLNSKGLVRRTINNATYKNSDARLEKQLQTFIRRLVFDQHRADDSKQIFQNFFTNTQGFSSALYMMLNGRAAIANVNYGLLQIGIEAGAGKYFSANDIALGMKDWSKSILGQLRSYSNELLGTHTKYHSLEEAVIGTLQVVDYDAVRGGVIAKDINHYATHIRDLMFSPQSLGENFMQNSVLFAMLRSHKPVALDSGDIRPMNKTQYVTYKMFNKLRSILTEEQKKELDKFKNDVKNDEDTLFKYATFRRDLLAEFLLLHCDKEQRKTFKKLAKDARKEIEEEFDNIENIYSQLILKDGELAFKENSELDRLDSVFNRQRKTSVAMDILGQMTEKTRKVNNKIHGVYNRLGAAYIENYAWGSVVMQFHKHLPMGYLKLWRQNGIFNETRGTIEKGSIISVFDVLAAAWRKAEHDRGFMNDDERSYLQTLIITAQSVTNIITAYSCLPPSERRNMRRLVGQALGVLSATLASAVFMKLKGSGDDDDDENLFWALCLYESDRLKTEANTYFPIGFASEFNSLYSSPVSILRPIKSAKELVYDIFESQFNSDYYPEYTRGRFRGENKIWHNTKRILPAWYGIEGFIDVGENFNYYLIGSQDKDIINIKDLSDKLFGED